MEDRYLIPAQGTHRVEDTIKRSLFITTMMHTSSVEEARACIQAVKNEYPDASHNCWAYQAGAPLSTACVGMSDDGEPHGTAGKPMLTTLLHSNVGEVACVVTRYFGGTKLGTGGLVRAYSGMVKLGLESLPVCEKITPVHLEIVLDYNRIVLFKRMLPEYEVTVMKEAFTADAAFTVMLPKEHRKAFCSALTEMTNGDVLIDECASPRDE